MKGESVIYKPKNKRHKKQPNPPEEEIFLEISQSPYYGNLGKAKPLSARKSYHQRYKRRQRNIRIVRVTAVVALLILLVVIGFFVYWALNDYFREASTDEVNNTTVATGTDDFSRTTLHYEKTSPVTISVTTSPSEEELSPSETPTVLKEETTVVEDKTVSFLKSARTSTPHVETPTSATTYSISAVTTPTVSTTTPTSTVKTPISTTTTPIPTLTTPIPSTTTSILSTATPILPITTPILSKTTPIQITTTPTQTTTIPVPTAETPIKTTTTQVLEAVIFVEGKFNFSQAEEACNKVGRTLAMKEDMEKAFEQGYERCQYGWMGDGHTGYVMQESGARPACGGGKVGLIYSLLKSHASIVGGANCASVAPTLTAVITPVPTAKTATPAMKESISTVTSPLLTTTTDGIQTLEAVIFVEGKFNFSQAKAACNEIDRSLATKEDMEKAFEQGYERCQYGWMDDGHTGYVMQESGARPACGGGKVGLIYSVLRTPESIVGGANCAPVVPVVFVSGQFNFTEAGFACAKIGKRLALKGDMEKAFRAGFERCEYGWLRDRHAGYVMQASGARPACGGGIVGVIYSSLKDFDDIVNGAYCVTAEKPDLQPLRITANVSKAVNWWVTMDPADIYDLKHLLTFAWKPEKSSKVVEDSAWMTKALRVVYPCCGFLNLTMTATGKQTTVEMRSSARDMQYLVETYKKEFGNPDLKIYPQVKASYEAMIQHGAATENRSQTISDLVDKVIASRVDGLIFDYEPAENYTRRHAEIYRDFIDALVEKLRPHNKKVAMLVSEWGILNYYDVYSKSDCEVLGSMSSTYYGYNITSNMQRIREMLRWINSERLEVGIGSMHIEKEKVDKTSYRWNNKQLKLFLDWLNRQNIKRLHIFPSQWGRTRLVERYYLNVLTEFVKS